MTYRGRVRGNVIVLDDSVKLPDGAEVSVELEPTPEEIQSLREGLRKLSGIAEGLPDDFAEQHDHYIHGTPKK
jgi:hypothetical protein